MTAYQTSYNLVYCYIVRVLSGLYAVPSRESCQKSDRWKNNAKKPKNRIKLLLTTILLLEKLQTAQANASVVSELESELAMSRSRVQSQEAKLLKVEVELKESKTIIADQNNDIAKLKGKALSKYCKWVFNRLKINQIFHCTRCVSPKCVTSMRGPFPRHCVLKTQLFSKNCCRGGKPLATLCVM